MNLKIVLLLASIFSAKASKLGDLQPESGSNHSQASISVSGEQAPVLPPELWAIILRILPKFSDIVNAVRAKRRFRMLEDAPKIYLDIGIEELELLKNELHSNNENEHLQHTKSVLKLYSEFLKYPLYKAATFVIIWRLFAIVPCKPSVVEGANHHVNPWNYYFFYYIANLGEVMIPFIKEHIDDKDDIKRHAEFKKDLAHHSKRINKIHHISILKRLDRSNLDIENEAWLQFGYMLLLESSNHLEKKFPYKTMLTLVDICCGANGHYIFHINAADESNDSDELLVEKRFELNWNFYKGKVTNEFKIGSLLMFASSAVNTISSNFNKRSEYDTRSKYDYVQVIGAIAEILHQKPANFKDLVDDIRLNFVFFDLETDDPLIQKCSKWLKIKCAGSRAVRETGLKEQVSAINKMVKNRIQLSDKDAFWAVYDLEVNTTNHRINLTAEDWAVSDSEGETNDRKKEYMQQLKAWFKEKCDFKRMENFSDYIEILKILGNVCTRHKKFFNYVWNALLRFVEKPSLFDNFEELFEVDELLISLFELDDSFRFESDERGQVRAKKRLDAAFLNFGHIFQMDSNELKDIRRRRILLKIILMLAKRAYSGDETIDQTGINRINQINKLVYRLAKYDDLSDISPSHDPCFLNEWFNNYFSGYTEIRDQLINPSNHDLIFVFQPIKNTTQPSARSPLFYLCIKNTLMVYYNDRMNYPPQLLKNAVTVDNIINHGEDFNRNIQKAFGRAKFYIYQRLYEKIEPYQNTNGLKLYIESSIDYLLNKFLKESIVINYGCYRAIKTAVEKSHNSGVDVKTEMGKEIIGMLDQIFKIYYLEYGDDFDRYNLGQIYKYLQKLLKFPVDSGIPTQLISELSIAEE